MRVAIILIILFILKTDEMLERDYKFYLSFENSICPDYVTEKFYNPLLFSTVPVVYGGADYEAVGAPPNSYIDVRNFKSGIFFILYSYYKEANRFKKTFYPRDAISSTISGISELLGQERNCVSTVL